MAGRGMTGAAVQQNGTGTTILTAPNTYTGGTTIDAGILQLGDGGTTGSIVGNVVDNATLAFNRSDTVTFGEVISGTGSVQTVGTGTTILTAANTYTGNTNVNGGALFVDGSLRSANVNVNPGGLLGGNGNFFGNVNNLGGIVSPGKSVGLLTIGGNYTQSAPARWTSRSNRRAASIGWSWAAAPVSLARCASSSSTTTSRKSATASSS